MSAQKYEYHVVLLSQGVLFPGKSGCDAEDVIDAMVAGVAAEGYRLHKVVPLPSAYGSVSGVLLFFERQKDEVREDAG